MLDEEQAKKLVYEQINANYFTHVVGDELVIIEDETITKPYGWVFFYTSRKYLETRDAQFFVIGNGAIIVEKETGALIGTGTARPAEYYIAQYEAQKRDLNQRNVRVHSNKSQPPSVELSSAIKEGDLARVRHILSRERTTDRIVRFRGMTHRELSLALLEAAETGNTEIVALLLDAGADVNTQNVVGWTALMKAAFHGHTEVVRLLLHHRANTKLTNVAGYTALDCALGEECTKLLVGSNR
jgi:hypothetical protein